MKGRHKASLLTATRKLENIFWWRAGLDMMQDAADLSVSFDLLGFYLPSITSSLRYWGLDYCPMAYHLLSVLYWCAQIWVMSVHTIVLLIARIHTRYNRYANINLILGQLNVGCHTGVHAIPFVVYILRNLPRVPTQSATCTAGANWRKMTLDRYLIWNICLYQPSTGSLYWRFVRETWFSWQI